MSVLKQRDTPNSPHSVDGGRALHLSACNQVHIPCQEFGKSRRVAPRNYSRLRLDLVPRPEMEQGVQLSLMLMH